MPDHSASRSDPSAAASGANDRPEGPRDIAPINDIEAALAAWRAAERRVAEADGNLTPEMARELVEAKWRYQEFATAHMTARIDALHAVEARRAAALPSTDPFHEAAAEDKAIARYIWAEADEIDRGAREAAEG
jgi:hypothetical protein